jgi:hypothetical protein
MVYPIKGLAYLNSFSASDGNQSIAETLCRGNGYILCPVELPHNTATDNNTMSFRGH